MLPEIQTSCPGGSHPFAAARLFAKEWGRLLVCTCVFMITTTGQGRVMADSMARTDTSDLAIERQFAADFMSGRGHPVAICVPFYAYSHYFLDRKELGWPLEAAKAYLNYLSQGLPGTTSGETSHEGFVRYMQSIGDLVYESRLLTSETLEIAAYAMCNSFAIRINKDRLSDE